jgi:hypothetical protein
VKNIKTFATLTFLHLISNKKIIIVPIDWKCKIIALRVVTGRHCEIA